MGLMDGLKEYWNQASGDKGEWSGKDAFGKGGKLVKAKLISYDKPGSSKKLDEIELFLNPAKVSVSKGIGFSTSDSDGNTSAIRPNKTEPVTLDIGELVFDCYDFRKDATKSNVRLAYIQDLEKMCDYDKDTHHAPVVRLTWGKFIHEEHQAGTYQFYIKTLKVDYTMFLPDGTPVRAVVKLTLQQATSPDIEQADNPKLSPDHAKLYTVKRGDTLQGIAMDEYDDPREWRRIAETNDVDDPMNLAPGTKLLVPPILK